jgi:hypothetical protein
MYKIFKYKLNPDLTVEMPHRARILRVAHVDDGFYKGDFVWAIVDTTWPNVWINLSGTIWSSSIRNGPHNAVGYRQELRVKEKQEIFLPGYPYDAQEDNGKIYVYHEAGGNPANYKIAVFKTGQEIDIPIDKLQYLGLNRLWIIQELGLYTFWVTG